MIYEGAFMRNHTRGLALWNTTKAVAVVHLTTSGEDCRKGIISRRQARGNYDDTFKVHMEKEFTDNRDRNYVIKMKAAGAQVVHTSREDGLANICKVLFDV